MIVCQATKGAASAGHWSWRSIDGKTCWYAGHHKVAKSQLTWEKSAAGEGGGEGVSEIVGEQKHYTRAELQNVLAEKQAPPATVQEQSPQELTPQQVINHDFAALAGGARTVKTVLYDNVARQMKERPDLVAVTAGATVPSPSPLPEIAYRNPLEVPVFFVCIAVAVLLWRAAVAAMAAVWNLS